LATELRTRTADDEMIYGLLTDANAELGKYKDAEDAAQWMLNVGRSSVPGLTRAAYLRETFGDIDGALELMNQVYNRLNPAETEDCAWTLTQIAHLFMTVGKIEEAGRVLGEALRMMPDYHYALAGMAHVRAAEAKYNEAVSLLTRRSEVAPHAENLFDLAVALRKAGKFSDAKRVFAEFERRALAESERWDNANRELVRYYADFANRPVQALRIASIEFGRRRDVMTLDAYAWALHKNGRSREGLAVIETAIGVGSIDARLLYHAGAIAQAAGRRKLAAQYFTRTLEVNSRSEVAAETRRLLATQQVAAPPKRGT
jgi:tetratricopeptide (TPR) repeat protein